MHAWEAVLEQLRSLGRPDQLAGLARFGIAGTGRLGVSIPDLRRLARSHKRQHPLALALWATGIPDARILAGMVDDPALVSARQMDRWAAEFASWDVCDQVCLNLFVHCPLAWEKARQWTARPEEFVRRAGFALLACLAVHDRTAQDVDFLAALEWIKRAAGDDRNFVRKAVNWALRQIGKRNLVLNAAAIAAAQEIQQAGTKAGRWIAADALRELTAEKVRARIPHTSLPKTVRSRSTRNPRKQ